MENKMKGGGNLSQLTCAQLQERISRQEKLLSNKASMDSLPDKGQGVVRYIERLRSALHAKQLIEATSMELEAMTFENKGKSAMSERPTSTAVKPAETMPAVELERHEVVSGLDKPRLIAEGRKKKGGKDLAALKHRLKNTPEQRRVVFLSTDEAAEIIVNQREKLQEAQMQYAREYLSRNAGEHPVGKVSGAQGRSFGQYRAQPPKQDCLDNGDDSDSDSLDDDEIDEAEDLD